MTAWRDLVADDEVLSVKTGRWYTVQRLQNGDGTTRVRFAGIAKSITKPATEPAGEVRRSDTGQAVDLLTDAFPGTEILRSGPA